MKKLSVNRQFMVVTAFILFICIALSACCFTVIGRLMNQRDAAKSQSNLENFTTEMGFLVQRTDAVFNTLLADENLEAFAASAFSAQSPHYIRNLQLKMSAYTGMNTDIADIAIASDRFLWSGHLDSATAQRLAAKLGTGIGLQCLGLQYSAMQQRSGAKPYLIFGQNFFPSSDYANSQNKLGTLYIALDLSRTYARLGAADLEGDLRFIIDNQNGVWYSLDADDALTEAVRNDYLEWLGGVNARRYLFETVPVSECGLTLLYVVNKDKENALVLGIVMLSILVIAAAALALALALRVILRNVLDPLRSMSSYMLAVPSRPSDNELVPLSLEGCAEITALSDAFNQMLTEQARLDAELRQRTVELYESALSRKQAELNFLRSQINPHFLYNTLGMMQDMAIENGLPQLADIAQAMGTMFRFSVKGSRFVPLEQELTITQSYLKIQNARFGGKIKVFTSVRSEVQNAPVMKLILQPLVENAIVHGILPKQTDGTIYIGAKAEDGCLVLSVYDDGVGIPPAKLEELCRVMREAENAHAAADAPAEHVGLINVYQRLVLQYGHEGRLHIDSEEGAGTRVWMKMPLGEASGEVVS